MAINVNTVYTTVLSILNKEQRGYLTPYEFNQLATQVQLEIFENFFEDYNQYIRMPKTDVEFASRMDHIHEEFQVFEENKPASSVASNVYNLPIEPAVHRFGSAFYEKAIGSPEIEIVSKREYHQQILSPILQPSENFPIAIYQNDKLTVYPAQATPLVSDVGFNYIRKPKDVRWGFSIGSLGQYIYDTNVYSANSINKSSLLSSVITNPTNKNDAVVTSINPDSTSGSGVDLSVNITTTGGSGSATVTSLEVVNQGSGYAADDIITFNAANFGGGVGGDLVVKLKSSDFNYDSTYGSTNFEISDSQQSQVILEVLKYAGVVIRDPSIVQAASQELAQDNANEKR